MSSLFAWLAIKEENRTPPQIVALQPGDLFYISVSRLFVRPSVGLSFAGGLFNHCILGFFDLLL